MKNQKIIYPYIFFTIGIGAVILFCAAIFNSSPYPALAIYSAAVFVVMTWAAAVGINQKKRFRDLSLNLRTFSLLTILSLLVLAALTAHFLYDFIFTDWF